MSAEKITNSEINDLPSLVTPQKSKEAPTKRVDINILLNRARKVQEKENRVNFVLVGLTLSLLFVVGIILSF
mgnify:CR=1 FL=1|jgi:hypothetical protein